MASSAVASSDDSSLRLHTVRSLNPVPAIRPFQAVSAGHKAVPLTSFFQRADNIIPVHKGVNGRGLFMLSARRHNCRYGFHQPQAGQGPEMLRLARDGLGNILSDSHKPP